MKIVGIVAAALLVAGCRLDLVGHAGSGSDPEVGFLFRLHGDPTGEQSFIAAASDPHLIAAARRQLQLPETERNLFPAGRIAAGNAAANPGWSWRYVTGKWELTDAAPGACEGTPLLVEDSIAAWLQAGTFCPSGAYVAQELVGESAAAGIIVRFLVEPADAVLQERIASIRSIADERGMVLAYPHAGALGTYAFDLAWHVSAAQAESLAREVSARVAGIDYVEANGLAMPFTAPDHAGSRPAPLHAGHESR